MIAQLGNPAPLHDVNPDAGEAITVVAFEDGITLDEAFLNVTHPAGLWRAQSAASSPSWVACSDPDLEARLCAHFGCSPLAIPGLNA